MGREKYRGVFRPTGKPIQFNRTFGRYRFSDKECLALLNGDFITIFTWLNKPPYSRVRFRGKIELQEYCGNKFLWF